METGGSPTGAARTPPGRVEVGGIAPATDVARGREAGEGGRLARRFTGARATEKNAVDWQYSSAAARSGAAAATGLALFGGRMTRCERDGAPLAAEPAAVRRGPSQGATRRGR